jgi:ligand-binding SRPBCC domain-containing protein
MPIIHIETLINAQVERCFDLSRSIDLHKISTSDTNETAIAGVLTGLIGLDEQVTWQATHFGIQQKLTSIITKYTYPTHFRDEQLKGIFHSFRHDHYFEATSAGTLMKDVFDYKSPHGFFGKIADFLFLKSYMQKLLFTRNQVIKEFAESDKWKEVLT